MKKLVINLSKVVLSENLKNEKFSISRGAKQKCELAAILKNQLDGSLPANPVNDRRIANAVTLKSTFCLP